MTPPAPPAPDLAAAAAALDRFFAETWRKGGEARRIMEEALMMGQSSAAESPDAAPRREGEPPCH